MIKDQIEVLAERCAAAGRLDLVVQMEVAKRLAGVLDDPEAPGYVLAQASRELRAIMDLLPRWSLTEESPRTARSAQKITEGRVT